MINTIKDFFKLFFERKPPFWWIGRARCIASVIFVVTFFLWTEGFIYPIEEIPTVLHRLLSVLVNHEAWLSNPFAGWILLIGMMILLMSNSLAIILTNLRHPNAVDDAYATGWGRWNTFFTVCEIAHSVYYLLLSLIFCASWLLHRDLFLVKNNLQVIVVFAAAHILVYEFFRIYNSEINKCKKACKDDTTVS